VPKGAPGGSRFRTAKGGDAKRVLRRRKRRRQAGYNASGGRASSPFFYGRDVNQPASATTDPYAAFRLRDYRTFSGVVFLSAMLQQTQGVALGWDVYDRTGSAMALGLVGLAQFLPAALFFLPAGVLADRFDRRRVMVATLALWGAASVGLAIAEIAGASTLWLYLWAATSTTANVANRPARDALLPQLVPGPTLANAVLWNTSLVQVASISGPALAGMLIAASGQASVVYALNAALTLLAALLARRIRPPLSEAAPRARSSHDLFAGLVYVWRRRVVLGVMALDLLAVLLSSATALLPLYARDILHVGATGLGWLSAAPAIGALAMAFAQGLRQSQRAGRAFFWAIGGFGAATALFGVSTSYWLSLAALAAIGALDNVNVVIRQTVVQLYTPDELRGRVSAVNRVFITSSNQLGAFFAGALATLTTPVFAVAAGGVATVLVVLAGLRIFPELRRLRTLSR
jgi:MFS family permease